jgi:hypothetical protein
MKVKFSRRDFLKVSLVSLGATFLDACGRLVKPSPTALPTPRVIPSDTFTPKPTATATATPAPQDVPIYQNSFEGISDLAASGITSTADVTMNTENFNYPGGGTALEINGVLQGAQYSNLYVDFSIKKLTGQDSLDLTNKTIYYSACIPADSAIDNISVYAGKGNQFVHLAGNNADWKKGAWHDFKYDLAYAQGLMKDCDTLRIAGLRNLSSGDAMTTSFLVDDLKWIGIDIYHVPVDNNVDSLRKYAADQHFKFGLYADYRNLVGDENDPFKNTPYEVFKDPWIAYLLAQEGTVNNVWGFSAKQNEDYSIFDYDRPEDVSLIKSYNYGNGNSMTALGYSVGGSGNFIPDWFRNLAFPEATKALMLNHIEKDLRYTKGQHPIWILFNEFILFQGYGENGLKNRQEPFLGLNGYDFGEYGHYSPWAASPTDSSLIEAAFIKAHEVDPDATLLLNDAYEEQIGLQKSEYLFRFASGLKAKGIPVDGVGFQMHNYIEPEGTLRFYITFSYPNQFEHEDMDTYMKNVDLNVKRYAKIGLKVAFTELDGYIVIDDLDLTSAACRAEYEKRLQWQAKYYAGLLKIAMDNDNVILYQTFGVTDRYPDFVSTMYPEYGNMLLFDKSYNPKPAYYQMLDLLKAA